jgi:hypothetical protein
VRNWDALSDSTRSRYLRNGINRTDYEAGVSLKAARGHGQTPERPSEAVRNPERYESYVNLRRDVRALKIALYGADRVGPGFGTAKGTGRAHLEKVKEILEKKLDYDGNWDQFWDDYPEYDRDDYADVEKYH